MQILLRSRILVLQDCYEIGEVEMQGKNRLKIPIDAGSMCNKAPVQLPYSDTIIKPLCTISTIRKIY
jgi:hypothetical protein